MSNTGVCPLYVVRLSTPIRNGALVRNVIRAGESYEMPAVLPRSVTAGMKGSAEELAAWEDGIVGNTHNRFTRDGYEFQGWSQDPKATAASLRTGDIIDVPQAGADLYAAWKRVKTEPTPAPTLPQTGGMLGLIGGMGAAVLLTGAGIAFKLRRR